MVWKKKLDHLARVLTFTLILISVSIALPSFSQSNSEPNKGWSNEQWEKAKEGLDYNEQTPKEKTKKAKEPSQQNQSSNSDWNLGESLSNIFNSNIGKITSIVLIIGVLVFAVIKLLVENRKSDNKKIVPVTYDENFEQLEDNLPETDLEKFLRIALEKGDYKQAVRILFLTTIQKLDESHLIKWKKDKTNMDYLREMRPHSRYNHFRELTLAYEIVWYGDTAINAEVYNKLNPSFINYNNQLASEFNAKK